MALQRGAGWSFAFHERLPNCCVSRCWLCLEWRNQRLEPGKGSWKLFGALEPGSPERDEGSG